MLSSGARSSEAGGEELAVWHVVAESCSIRERPEEGARSLDHVGRGGPLRVDERSSVTDRALAANPGAPGARQVRNQTRGFSWLKVRSPRPGWCAASECCCGDGGELGARWRYVVVCRDGAFVRRGLELASAHLYTLARDAVFEVRERRVNEQGLARLRCDDGWVSEDLNPLSGQRGPIAAPLPTTSPLTYKVVLRDGAVVRETVELSSAIVHVVPCGALVEVDDKQFSDHPANHCVPRLRLTAPVHGWVSQRLNREPPDDLDVVELVGVATPGSAPRAADARPAAPSPRRPAPRSEPPRKVHAAHAPSADGHLSAEKLNDAINAETLCVVCLSSARNATFVHGETGHIACCLECARALRARGDSCPVCRTPIDLVIQHYWA